MKSIFKVALCLIISAFVPLANANEASIGLTGGQSMPHMGCGGCPSLVVSDQTQYGIDWRVLTPATDKLGVGFELEAITSPSTDVTINGRKAGSVNSKRLSLTPMLAVKIGKSTAYVGAGITKNNFSFEDTQGSASDNNTGHVVKIGFDRPITRNTSLGLQWERSNADYTINGTSIDSSQHAVKARLAYDF